MANCQKLTPEQYNVYKQEFLQKQKINTHQIRIVIDKLATNPLNTTYHHLHTARPRPSG